MPLSSEQTSSSQAYWNVAAETYDQEFTNTIIGQLWREAVWVELDRGFKSGQRVVELNCGTGVDAVHLANSGIQVVACDISPRMIELARKRATMAGLCGLLDFRVVATEMISVLETEGPFDGAFSNFSGLNCVEDLSNVKRDLARLLKPGGRIFVCMLGRFSAWDTLRHVVHGNYKKVFQRCQRGDGVIKVQYPSIKEIEGVFSPQFSLRRWKGIGVTLPPSYVEHWARRFPHLTMALARVDRVIGRVPPLRSMASCILLEMERTRTVSV
jgi:ubiquinone/menaquinone biosynthesis C-methylase UbiE